MILNKECVLLQNEIRKFAQQAILDKVDELDKAGLMPTENIGKLAEMGILGANAPEEFDGAALDMIGTAVALEEIGKVCASTALIVAVQNACFIYPIVKYGSNEQKQKYLSAASTGGMIGGYAMMSANQLSVQKQDSAYILKGINQFLLNGEANGPFVVYAQDDNAITAFIVDADSPGIKRSKTKVMGLNSAGIGTVMFEDFRASEKNILGGAGQGKAIFDEINALVKLYYASIALGMMEGSFDAALKYARERVQFNEPIINFGMIREKFADIAVRIEASRNFVYSTAMIADSKGKYQRLASIAKYFAGQSVVETTTQVIQIYGGYGYMKDYPVERYFRDAQVLNVLGDRPDIEKELIVKDILGG